MKARIASLLSILVVASMILTACAAPTPQVVEKVVQQTVVVEKQVQVTQQVVKEVVVTPTAAPKAAVFPIQKIRVSVGRQHHPALIPTSQ